MVVALLVFASAALAAHQNQPLDPCGGQSVTAKQFRPFSASVWDLQRWTREKPKPSTIAAYRTQLVCAAGPGHRAAIKRTWRRDRATFYRHRRAILEQDINHVWDAHWAPDWSGPTLPLHVIAALAERAGDYVGVNVPGWTMAEVTIGESSRRPGSAGLDVGGTRGYGLWAITWPFADAILAKYRWIYEDMWNPVKCAIVMAEIFRLQGLAAWYGDGFVTDSDRHYRGHFDLRRVLGGLTFAQALRADLR